MRMITYSNPTNYRLKPTAENQPTQSDDVIFRKAVLIASVSIEISLIFIVRKTDFIFDHSISIGLKSGLYAGRYSNVKCFGEHFMISETSLT